jgi:hypothetical protein
MIIRFRVLVIIADRCPTIDQEPLSIDEQIQRRLHGMGMDRQLSTIPSALLALHDKSAVCISEDIFST